MQLDLYDFRSVHGHYEVYKKENGSFVVSGDTYKEAVSSLLSSYLVNKMIAWTFRGCQVFCALFYIKAEHMQRLTVTPS